MKDNAKLIVQVLLIFFGGYLAKRGIDESALEAGVGAVLTIAGIIWKFTHWHSTPDVPPDQTNKPASSGAIHLLLLLALLLPATCLPLAGCHSTPQRAAYTTVATTSVTVETALRAYNAFAAAGKTTVAQNQQVKAAYEKYQQAFALVCDAGAVYAATSQTNAPAASAALQTAIVNANQSINDLVTLIQSFGVKL